MPTTYHPKRPPLDPCPLEAVLAMIGGKWKARILYLLVARSFGFADLRRALGAISQEVLATQLRALARDGLIQREASGEAASQSAYAATAKGVALFNLLLPVALWGDEELREAGRH